ncbi:hypothetical protein FB45DRAFT_878594 [Roridomyces roridus]|uniref:Uncharacterized protein n=1 Tax=Roridomyces roridus TaxID=1738132 RepID=A0AAD7B143_9AGAR|nr:hypothetical protein FB45DRAFT_878594 [Roridomyces roridus]
MAWTTSIVALHRGAPVDEVKSAGQGGTVVPSGRKNTQTLHIGLRRLAEFEIGLAGGGVGGSGLTSAPSASTSTHSAVAPQCLTVIVQHILDTNDGLHTHALQLIIQVHQRALNLNISGEPEAVLVANHMRTSEQHLVIVTTFLGLVIVTGRATRGGSRTHGYPPQPVGTVQILPNMPFASTVRVKNVREDEIDMFEAAASNLINSSKICCGYHGPRATRRPAARPVPVIAGTGFSGYGYGSSREYPRETRDDH